MKSQFRFLAVFIPLFTLGLVEESSAAEKEGEWVRIPSKWLLNRFARPSTAPIRSFKVALAYPPGAKQAKVVKSSGSSDVDQMAADFALESIQTSGPLRALRKSKELYFQFVITPPALDVKLRTKEGLRPMPPDKEIYTPSAPSVFIEPNHNQTTVRPGKVVVFFPPSGGYATSALITVSTGNSAADGYYVRNAALNWQTSRKSSSEQVYTDTFNFSAPQRWHSIYDR